MTTRRHVVKLLPALALAACDSPIKDESIVGAKHCTVDHSSDIFVYEPARDCGCTT